MDKIIPVNELTKQQQDEMRIVAFAAAINHLKASLCPDCAIADSKAVVLARMTGKPHVSCNRVTCPMINLLLAHSIQSSRLGV